MEGMETVALNMEALGMKPVEGDARGLAVRFYSRPVVDTAATALAGRTVHADSVYVEIAIPGDKTTVVDRPLHDWDKHRFPREWLAFQAANGGEVVVGTLLSAWGALSPALVEDYRSLKVRTVEQLANLSDANVASLGLGGIQHRKMARDFIEAAKSNAPLLRMQKELEEERNQRRALEALVHSKMGTLAPQPAEAFDAPATEEAPDAPKRRGRPPKAKEATP